MNFTPLAVAAYKEIDKRRASYAIFGPTTKHTIAQSIHNREPVGKQWGMSWLFLCPEKNKRNVGELRAIIFHGLPTVLRAARCLQKHLYKILPAKIPKRDSHFPKKTFLSKSRRQENPGGIIGKEKKRRSSSLKLPFKPLFVPRKGHTKKINSTLQKECRVMSQGILESQEFFFRNDLPKQPSTLWCKV